MDSTRPLIGVGEAVSAYGIGWSAFAEGVREGRPPARQALGRAGVAAAASEVIAVPYPDPARLLEGKGTRALDRVTALSLLATRELLARWVGLGPADGSTAELNAGLGVVLGTKGSYRSVESVLRASLTGARPFYVNTAEIPNAVMNCAAARCAIWHGLGGPNVTIASGRVSGLAAIGYARRLLLAGHAPALVWGGADEATETRLWLERTPGTQREDLPLGEGCVMFPVRSSADGPWGDGPWGDGPWGDGPVIEVLGLGTRTMRGGEDGMAVAGCVGRTLARAGVSAEQVWAVSTSGPQGSPEAAAVREALGRSVPCDASVAGLLGDLGAASGAAQVAAVLALAEPEAGTRDRFAVVTSTDPDLNLVACALLRVSAGR
jgi:3-oxoacyl-[acyl-carrier-protein] synthase II